MNKTNFKHALYALLMQLPFGLAGEWWMGAAFGAAFFFGREHAQREYRIGDPSKLSGFEALDFWDWSLDAKLDLLFPVVAVLVVAAIMNLAW